MSSEESKVNQEEILKELKEMKTLIFALDKKVDVGFAEVKGEFKRIDGEFKCLNGEVKRLEEKLDTKFEALEKKVDDKFDGWEKRLEFSEFISRGSVTAIFLGFVGAVAKFVFFSN